MIFLWYDLSVFDEIYTANDFYSKENLNIEIFKKIDKKIIKNSISIWDEINDYIHLEKIWWTWIDINNSSIYS